MSARLSTIHGASVSHPFRPDSRGQVAAETDPARVVEQQIMAVIETRPGERLMLPDLGLPDAAFAVRGAGFARMLSYHLQDQVRKYVPGVDRIEVLEVSAAADGEHVAHVSVEWTLMGSNVPHNLVFPTRRLADF